MYRRRIVSLASVLLLAACLFQVPAEGEQRGPSGPQQQRGGQQQPRPQPQPQSQQQRQMAMMLEMIQHMEQVANRAQAMSERFGQQSLEAQSTLRERLRVHQQMCDSIAVSARETRRGMERVQEMLQDGSVTQDRDMERDLEQVREHLQVVAGGLDDALNAMARIQDRLGASAQ